MKIEKMAPKGKCNTLSITADSEIKELFYATGMNQVTIGPMHSPLLGADIYLTLYREELTAIVDNMNKFDEHMRKIHSLPSREKETK